MEWSPWWWNTWVIFMSHSKTYKISFRCWAQRLHGYLSHSTFPSTSKCNCSLFVHSNDFIDVFIHILLTMQLLCNGRSAIDCRCLHYNALQFRNDFVECNAKPNEQRTIFCLHASDRMRTRIRFWPLLLFVICSKMETFNTILVGLVCWNWHLLHRTQTSGQWMVSNSTHDCPKSMAWMLPCT